MTLRTAQGRPTAENSADASEWLRSLTGCPPINATQIVQCANHGEEAATWFYVEADAQNGVARARCLGCGQVQHLLDSQERWTFPSAWLCVRCNQTIAELVLGAHQADGVADWVAVAARCVDCGTVTGLTDVVVSAPGVALSDVLRHELSACGGR